MQFHYCMHCQEYHQLKSPSIIFSVTDSPVSTGRSTAGSTTMLMTIASNPGVSVALIGAVIGGVAGASLVLVLLLLLLALVWMTKKYKRAANFLHQLEQPEGKEQRKAVHQQQQHQYDEAMEMKNNGAYISTIRQVPTEDNVAYCQIESDHNLDSDQCEYDYI